MRGRSGGPQEVAVVKLERLAELRHARFLSQSELAAASGVHQVTISRLEQGLHEPTGKTVRQLAQALGVEPAQLVGESTSQAARGRSAPAAARHTRRPPGR